LKYSTIVGSRKEGIPSGGRPKAKVLRYEPISLRVTRPKAEALGYLRSNGNDHYYDYDHGNDYDYDCESDYSKERSRFLQMIRAG
jgi:hypothetical protein